MNKKLEKVVVAALFDQCASLKMPLKRLKTVYNTKRKVGLGVSIDFLRKSIVERLNK